MSVSEPSSSVLRDLRNRYIIDNLMLKSSDQFNELKGYNHISRKVNA